MPQKYGIVFVLLWLPCLFRAKQNISGCSESYKIYKQRMKILQFLMQLEISHFFSSGIKITFSLGVCLKLKFQ